MRCKKNRVCKRKYLNFFVKGSTIPCMHTHKNIRWLDTLHAAPILKLTETNCTMKILSWTEILNWNRIIKKTTCLNSLSLLLSGICNLKIDGRNRAKLKLKGVLTSRICTKGKAEGKKKKIMRMTNNRQQLASIYADKRYYLYMWKKCDFLKNFLNRNKSQKMN